MLARWKDAKPTTLFIIIFYGAMFKLKFIEWSPCEHVDSCELVGGCES